MENRRKNTRLPLKIDTEAKFGSKILTGISRNISFGGLMAEFAGNPPISEGELCQLSLQLPADREKIVFEGEVIHASAGVVGFKFHAILGVGCYDKFKNLMIFNSPEPEELTAELRNAPGLCRDE